MDEPKAALRDKVWRRLLDAAVVPPDSYGKIPAYEGADRGAQLLAELDIWRRASTVKANPDHAQLDVRRRALADGKLLYMAVPKMASLQPFFALDPETLTVPAAVAADKKGAAQVGRRVGVFVGQGKDLAVRIGLRMWGVSLAFRRAGRQLSCARTRARVHGGKSHTATQVSGLRFTGGDPDRAAS